MKASGGKYIQLIPERVNAELEAIESIIRPVIKNYSGDYLKEVISIIACQVRKDDDDAPLKSVFIRQLVPYAERYLDALIDLGIIYRSPYYIPGEISYRYNFTPEYRSEYIPLPLRNNKFIRRIKKAYDNIGRETVKNIRGFSSQVKYLKQLSLAEGWEELVNGFRDDVEVYNSVLASAMRIVNNDIFYSRDATEGRFHSNITNMKKELRPYLRLNGKPLVNIDVKNSQPYLSTILLTYPSKVAGLTKNNTFSMLLQTLKVSHNDDVKKYIKLVADGQFYEYLINEFARGGILMTRQEAKLQVLRILFAPNRLPKNEVNRKCRLIFRQTFPTVHRIFSKVRGRDQGTKFENSNRFAILLATIESYLMLDVILKRIYREFPGVIAITIHDSIMTGILTDDVEAVRKIMAEELTNFVGFAPKIEIEDYLRGNKEEKQGENSLIQYVGATAVSVN
ncbi:MAG: hypothetical protein WAW07_09680 [Bacteroidales bacterium]